MEQMDKVKAELRKEEQDQNRRLRLGEITDIKGSQDPTPGIRSVDPARSAGGGPEEASAKNEFDKIYTSAGASGMNAGTDYDYTIYFINVPANKLELWYWMESDRLMNPVFREFYTERDVVHEERRMRTDSTPTGKSGRGVRCLVLHFVPYEWPVVAGPPTWTE